METPQSSASDSIYSKIRKFGRRPELLLVGALAGIVLAWTLWRYGELSRINGYHCVVPRTEAEQEITAEALLRIQAIYLQQGFLEIHPHAMAFIAPLSNQDDVQVLGWQPLTGYENAQVGSEVIAGNGESSEYIEDGRGVRLTRVPGTTVCDPVGGSSQITIDSDGLLTLP